MRFDYQVVNSDFNYLNKDSRVDLGQHLGQAIFSMRRHSEQQHLKPELSNIFFTSRTCSFTNDISMLKTFYICE